MKKLTTADICEAAKELNCDPVHIRALQIVESRDGGFDDEGRIILRFEGHVFRKYTDRRYDTSHPHLSYPYNQMHSKRHGYGVFSEAFALDPHAALMSTSWGMFQPMGFNFDELGYDSVNQMVEDLKTGEKAQLMAFVRLIKHWGLDDELRRFQANDCRIIAARYNGAGYKENRYDEKMVAYAKTLRAKGGIKCPDGTMKEPVVVTVSSKESPEVAPVNEVKTEVKAEKLETKIVDAPPKEDSTATATTLTIGGFTVPAFLVGIISAVQSAIANGFVSAADVGNAVIGFVRENTKYVLILVGLIIVGMFLKKFWKQFTLWKQMDIAADPNRHDVEVQPQ